MAEKQVRKIDDLVIFIFIQDERSIVLSLNHEEKTIIIKKTSGNIVRKSTSKSSSTTSSKKANGLEKR